MNSRKTLVWIYLIFMLLLGYQMATTKPLPPPTPVRIVADSNKFVLPKTPIISLINTSAETVTVDTCRDIQIVANGLTATKLPEAFCRTVEVPPETSKNPLGTHLFGHTKDDILYYQVNFANIPEAHLSFVYTSTLGESSEVAVRISHAGVIRLFFRTLFYNPVYNLFAGLILIFPGYSLGWAIVTITLLIRFALLIPQQKMLVSQRKMQTIQPKIKHIQETHKGDQATIGMKMMELYKTEGVNPVGSCLPMLIQIPILIVLYQVILNIASPTNLAHLYDISWLENFKNIAINPVFYGLHLEKTGGVVGIILGLVTGMLQFGQMWLAQKKMTDNGTTVNEKSKTKNEELSPIPDMQKMQKTMMYVFPIMAAYFTYILPAGLGLYWLIGTLFMIIQQAIANQQTAQKKVTVRDAKGHVLHES